jgi:hypothetical protein
MGNWSGLLQATDKAVSDASTRLERRQSTLYYPIGSLRPFNVFLKGNQLDDINTLLSIRHVDLIFFEPGA